MKVPTRPLALAFATIAVLGTVLGGLAASATPGAGAAEPTLLGSLIPQGGPAPNGPTNCPGGTPYSAAQVVIEADGSVEPAGAPVTVSGSLYQLNEPLDSSLLDLASNATVDLSNCLVTYTTVDGYGNNSAVEVRGVANVTVEYLSSTAPGDEAVYVVDSSAVSVYGIGATHALDIGIWIQTSQDVNVSDNNVSFSNVGVYLASVIDAGVLDNQVVAETGSALETSVTSNALFLNNDGRYAAFYGANLEYDSGTLVSGNDLSGNLNNSGTGTGIYSYLSDSDRFVGNNLSGTNAYGVYVSAPTGSMLISHNDLTGGLEYGVGEAEGYFGSGVTIRDNDIENVTLDGIDASQPGALNITGNSFALAAAEPSAIGINLEGAIGAVTIAGNRLSGGYGTGVLFSSSGGTLTVARNVITNTSYEALDVAVSSGATIVSNDLDVNTTGPSAGIYVGYSNGVLSIVGNQITGGFLYGLDLYVVNGTLIVRGNNAVAALDDAILIFETEGASFVSGNALGANASTADTFVYGIYVDDYLAGPSVISDNDFGGGLFVGIYLTFAFSDLNISDNAFTNVTAGGVDLDQEALGNSVIWGNVFSKPAIAFVETFGLFWAEGGGNLSIVDNVFEGGFYAGAVSMGVLGTTLLEGNVFDNVSDYGAAFEESANGLTAVDNQFLGNDTAYSATGIGLYLVDESGTVGYVANNTIAGGLGTGILDSDSEIAQTLVYNNTIQDPVQYGVQVTNSAGPVAVVGSTISAAQGFGILATDDANLTIQDNQVTDANVAINISDDDAQVLVDGNNASGSNASLEVDMSDFESVAILEDNDLSNSKWVAVNNSLADFIANDLLGTPTVWLTNDSFSEFYHNNLETDGPAFLDLFDSAPLSGVYNAPLPIGGNYWTGYTGTSCSYVCSPPYEVPSQSGSSGYLDEYPLGTAWTAYAITFEESGLPAGTTWSVTFNGSVLTAVAPASIVVYPSNIVPVTFPYAIPAVGTYTQVSPSSGSVTTSGTSETIAVTFAEPTYAVSFSENGLAVGMMWYVNSTGTPAFASGAFAVTSAGTQTFAVGDLTNGTYAFSVAVDRGGFLATTPTTGTFTVDGAATTVAYVYATVNYTVSFQQSGLPAGGLWTVTINGAPQSSTGAALAFSLPNGTYSFSVTVPTGYVATPAQPFTVAGGPVASYIAISATPSSSSSSSNNTLIYGLVAGLVIAAALAVIAFALLARKGRGGAASTPPPAWSPPPAGASAAPPAPGEQPWSEGGPTPPSPPSGG